MILPLKTTFGLRPLVGQVPCGLALVTFHVQPAQTLRFKCNEGVEPTFHGLEGRCITIMQIAKLPRSAVPVVPCDFDTQNATLLISFVRLTLLNHIHAGFPHTFPTFRPIY